MKRIIEYILFAINTIILVFICFFNTWSIIENYEFNLNEINPFLWLFIVLIIIVINTYLFIKQKKRILISLILFLILLVSYIFLIISINHYNDDCIYKSIYKGKITLEKEDTTNTYAIALQNLENLTTGFDISFPDSLNKYDRISTIDTIDDAVDTKTITIVCYDTIKNQQFITKDYYSTGCELDMEMIKNISNIPIRIYKNGNLLVDTCLKIESKMVKYRDNTLVIEFDELKIKNAP